MLSPDAEAVMSYIRQRRATSLVEVERVLEARGVDTKGSLAVAPDRLAEMNIFIWFGASEAFAEVLREIKPLVDIAATQMLVYVIDGKAFRCPVAKQARIYKEEHWFPVVLTAKKPEEEARHAPNGKRVRQHS